jgi:hypothetical protein
MVHAAHLLGALGLLTPREGSVGDGEEALVNSRFFGTSP